MRLLKLSLVIASVSSLLVACGETDKPVVPTSSSVVTPVAETVKFERKTDLAKLVRGGQIFKQNCASCHGDNAQGADNWQKRDANGKFLAPPLNGTGHAWHHPMSGLKQTIYFGTERIGGSMPGWKDALTEAQIDDVLFWVQAKWPDELYQVWAKNDLRSRNRETK